MDYKFILVADLMLLIVFKMYYRSIWYYDLMVYVSKYVLIIFEFFVVYIFIVRVFSRFICDWKTSFEISRIRSEFELNLRRKDY